MDVGYNIRSSSDGFPEHLMVPVEVCDGQEQARSTLDGREVDLNTHGIAHARDSSRNGLTVMDVGYNIRSSTRRLPENTMVSIEVCDAREQARSTLDGRERSTKPLDFEVNHILV